MAGAGFAGLQLALRLPRPHRVTVVDPSPHFEFIPNIHELVSGFKAPGDLRLSRPSLVRRAGHTFLQARVAAIDLAGRRVVTDAGALSYDVLAVAVGAVGTTYGVPGAAEHALPFRSVDHCAAIGARLRTLASGAASGPPRVVVVGGGLEGVEALGEILRAHRGGLGVTLVEARDRLLPEVPGAAVDRDIRRRCEGLPVRWITGERVESISDRGVALSGGEELPADAVIWTGGLAPPPLLADAGLSPSADRWAPVRRTLVSCRDERVFVLGDPAQLPEPLDKQAYHALDMGTHAARNIDRLLRGRRLEPFVPAKKPMLVSFGDLSTYLIAGEVALSGPALSTAKEAVYQLVMSRLDARRGLGGLQDLLRRSGKGLLELARANLASTDAIGRGLSLRVLR